MRTKEKPKIYLTCFAYNWASHEDLHGQAVAEDGEVLASHLSSSVEWAKHDLGLTSDWKHDLYAKYYPDGYEVVWIDSPSTDPRWRGVLAKNQALQVEEKKEKEVSEAC